MNINVTVTHTLHPDVLELLKGLIRPQAESETLIPRRTAANGNGKRGAAPAAAEPTPAPADNGTAAAVVSIAPAADTATADEEATHEAVKALVAELSQKGKRDAAKAVVTKYASKIADLSADQLPEVIAELKKL